MTKGPENYEDIALPVVMLGVGFIFVSMGVAHYPVFLVTGMLYLWVGIRGVWFIRKRHRNTKIPAAIQADESPTASVKTTA